jgi:tetratricopeptide (TPR) repeat protein
MVNKKKKAPPVKTKPERAAQEPQKPSLQACQDLYEKAMLDADENRWSGFKLHMIKANKAAESLLIDLQNDQSGEEEIVELKDFLAQCCFEIGTYLLEEDEDDGEGTKSATSAKPYLERAIGLYKSQPDAGQTLYRPTVIALSEAYATLHLHDQDIQLCEEFLAKLTNQYNMWTPLQNDVLVALGLAYNMVGRLQDAERAYKEIVALCKLNFGDNDERTSEAEGDLELFAEEKEFAVCECMVTKEQLEERRSRLLAKKQPQKTDR